MNPLTAGVAMLLVSVTIAAGGAAAQDDPPTERKWPPFGLGLGAGLRDIVPAGDATTSFVTVTPLAHFIPRDYRAGLVPAIRLGFGKQPTTLVAATSAGETEVGSVYVRPLTLGLGWSQPLAHRMAIVFSGSAGYSWNGFDADDNGRGSPRLLLPAAVAHVDNSFAWDVSARAWYDFHPRASLLVGVSFLGTRPELTLADGSTRRWNANQIRLDVGVAFTVLEPKSHKRKP